MLFSCKFQSSSFSFTMFPNYLFFISLLISCFIFTHSYHNIQCLYHQNNLLLQLKNELIFNSSLSTKLVHWNQTNNCCHWYGVECDGAGRVVSLQLDDESISGGIRDTSSLFGLEYLEKLNLAYNDFNSSLIPKGIKHLKYLTHLNLSSAGFIGQVPLQISSLKRLVSLDISCDYDWYIEPPKLKHPNLEMLVRNLTGLRELYLDGVNITSSRERSNWSHIISSHLPNLTALSLRDCDLSGPLAKSFAKLPSLSVLILDGNNHSTANPDLFANFSSLTTLSLVDCSLKGSFPHKIFQIPTLQHLDLSFNQLLSGSLPPFPHSGSLKSLILTRTNFSGSIPSSIGNLKALSEIDLSYCRFGGPIPSTFANLTQLTHVELSSNLFTGSLSPTMFDGLSNLVYLSLANNLFTGVIEEFPTLNVSKIVGLDLSGNRLEGPIPDSFFQLRSLELLFLGENLFNGSFQLEKIQSFANLTVLDLSGINLLVHVNNDNWSSSGLPMLSGLWLSSCYLHDFPHFIKQYSNQLQYLDLSNNRISGEIPSWIWGTNLQNLNISFNLFTHVQKPFNIPPSLLFLDLQSNQLKEELHLSFPPNITPELGYLSLANNSLSGSIPTSLCTATSLVVLDLYMNKLSGTIPSCLLDGTMDLIMLDLGRNNFSGHIPDSLHLDCRLQYLNLSNNTLQGKIPKSLKSCKWLELMNLGKNLINDTFPCMMSSSLQVLVLRSNRFHGEVKCHNNSWPELQIIDISSNDFSGTLTSINFSSWRGMVQGSYPQRERTELMYNGSVAREENNNFTVIYNLLMAPKARVTITMKGIEVDIVKIFPDFTTIDFSSNNFHGEIPKAIGDLSSLRFLNLSHNAINGSIPKSFGKLGELESLDLSRNQLTGHIPTELSRLTFLSVLNVSYNELEGEIPKGSQLQLFSTDSFIGNPGLCGFNLNISCTNRTNDDDEEKERKKKKKREIDWDYVSASLGYVVGLGGFVWVLIFCRSFRYKYFGKIDEIVEEMFDAIDKRQRRRRSDARRRRAVRDREARRH